MVNILDEGEVGFGSTEYIVFRARPGISDPGFVYYLVSSPIVREPAIQSMVGTSGRQRVQTDVVEGLQISFPPLPIQRRIATVLSALDDKIELNNRINANLEAQAQALFRSWFVDFEPWGGAMPSGWREGKLEELVEICYGKDHKKLNDGKIPVFGSGGIMRHADKALYDNESVLIPRKGSITNVMYVDEPFWTVDTMFFTKMRVPNSAKFVFQLVRGFDLESLNTGSAVPSLTTDILNNQSVIIPRKDSIGNYDEAVSPIYMKMRLMRKENRTLAALRDALLPKLMRGEIDVEKVEVAG